MPTVGATTILDRLGPKRSDAEFIKSQVEAPGSRFLVLADLKPVIRSDAPNEIPAQWLDSAKAMDRLGWTPALTLDAGLERTVPWYREALT